MTNFNFLSNLLSLSLGSRKDEGGTRLRVVIDSLSTRYRVLPLKLVSVLAILLMVGVGNAWADYTIEFKDGSGTDAIDASTLSNFINSGASYVTSASSDYMYPSASTGYGIRLASSNYAGYLILNLSATGQIKASKITFNVAYYGSDESTMPYVITYTDDTETEGTISTLSSTLADKDVTLTSTKTIKTIEISTTAKKKRVYVHSIKVTAAPTKTLSSIAITTQPTKRAYLVEQTFSSTGAVVTATYSDASTSSVSATWTPTTGLVSGSNTITASYTEGGVTKTATTTVTGYTVTVQVKDVDGNTVSGVGAQTASATGASITASASGNNYVFKRWVAVTAAGTSFADASNRSTTLSGTPTGNVTIKAEYYKPINVYWKVKGAAWTPATAGTSVVGYNTAWSSLTLPTDPTTSDGCGDKFMGWTPGTIATPLVKGTDDAAITALDLLNSGNKSSKTTEKITTETTFHAVFADYTK